MVLSLVRTWMKSGKWLLARCVKVLCDVVCLVTTTAILWWKHLLKRGNEWDCGPFQWIFPLPWKICRVLWTVDRYSWNLTFFIALIFHHIINYIIFFQVVNNIRNHSSYCTDTFLMLNIKNLIMLFAHTLQVRRSHCWLFIQICCIYCADIQLFLFMKNRPSSFS